MRELADRRGIRLVIAHVNYHLRGEESDRDEKFIRTLGETWGIPVQVYQVDSGELSGKRQSLQVVCRRIRFAYFSAICREFGAERIALGHTLDDNVETFFLRLLNGAGLTGLKGMQPLSGNRIIRPLLAVTRESIIGYLGEQTYQFVEDSSNLTDHYRRNRIRHHLVPFLVDKFQPRLLRILGRTLETLRSEDDFLEQLTESYLNDSAVIVMQSDAFALRRTGFEAIPPAIQRRVLLAAMVRTVGAESLSRSPWSMIEGILRTVSGSGRAGKDLSPGNLEMTIDAEFIRIRKKRKKTATMDARILRIPGQVWWESPGVGLAAESLSRKDFDLSLLRGPATITCFDRDLLPTSDRLLVRTRLPGDRFIPFGETAVRSVKNFLIANKIPRERRSSLLLVLSENTIIWVAGCRRSSLAPVTASTREVVVVRLLESQSIDR
jgi:tRNA(Ile)-lysidine synthase